MFLGGGFTQGSAQMYDGLAQAKKGNIVVVIQYRLGLFGFMNLFDEENKRTEGGNYGFLDQQKALEFVHKNARDFNGDPDRITIAGESAGGMSVGLHLLRPESSK